MSQTQSPLDDPEISEFIDGRVRLSGDTNATIAKQVSEQFNLPTSADSIRRWRRRHGVQIPGTERAFTKVDGDKAEAVTAPRAGAPWPTDDEGRPILDDPDRMLRDRGLDPEEWYIDAITVNEWDGPKSGGSAVTYYQAKFTARRKKPDVQIVAPRTDGWRPPVVFRNLDKPTQLYVIVGDQQAPFHDPQLHELFLSWLKTNTPDYGISLGDSVDFPDISRHQLDPENTAVVNECLQSGYDLFRGYVEASPGTSWKKLYGNHDERIRNLLLDKPKNNALYGIKRPNTPEEQGEEVLELDHLMRLDELGIELVRPHGKYDLGQIKISDKLAVRHGWIARKGSGASASATLEHLGYSVIVGHTHRQAIVHESKHEIDGSLRTITGVETGCMCRVEQIVGTDGRIWPNYAVAPDWQQGFATVEVWDDGYFNIDTAKYVNGVLLWRDQRYHN